MENRGVEPLASCLQGRRSFPTELIPHNTGDRDGTRTRIFPLDKRALSPLSYTANDADLVVRGGIEPPASAVSERRSQPTELPDTGTPCGTRTRSSALKGRKTNPYPNEASVCAASSGLEPESPGSKVRWVTDYPTRQGVTWLTRQDSNLNRLIQNQPCYRLHHGSSSVWYVRRDSNPLRPKATALQAVATSHIRLARTTSESSPSRTRTYSHGLTIRWFTG